MQTGNKVYVIIIIYNGLKWIDKCLNSIRQSAGNVHAIIIDNGSTDGSREKIAKDFPEMRFIKTEKNLGFGKANNLGMSIAIDEGADYVLLLNQDAWVEKDTIEGLVNIAAAEQEYGIISPIHLNGSYTALDLNFSNYVIPEKCPGFYSDMYLGKSRNLYELEFVNAAAWLMSARCLKAVGMFEPMFFFYGEDNNYLQRVRNLGFKIGVTPRYTICHDREIRKGKPSPTSLKIMKRTHSLIVLLDVTMGYGKAVLKFLKNTAMSLLRNILKGDITGCRYDVREIFFLVGRSGKIRKTRGSYHQHFIKN